MQVIEVSKLLPKTEGCMVLAIGKFDGVHVGHKAILRKAKSRLQPGDTLAVMSLWPHPAWVLGGQKAYERSLTPFPEKVRLLEEQGVQRLFTVNFTPEYAKIAAEEFVFQHLSRLSLRCIVVGEDFHFGAGGEADATVLTSMCKELGVPVEVVPDVEEQGIKIASSQIRKHILAGRVDAAEALLGRPYVLRGEVVHGDARGRQIGFPTANLADNGDYVLPGNGVYAVSVALLDGGASKHNWFGVMNVGMRPTVDGLTFQMEVHLIDFSGDLYGRDVEVTLLGRVRDEQKFAGIQELQAQIRRDIEAVRQLFGLSSV